MDKKKNPTVTEFDFTTVSKIDKNQLERIKIVFESFAKELSLYFSDKLRVSLSAKLAEYQQAIFSQVVEKLPNPAIISIFRIYPQESDGMVLLSQGICLRFIERMLGSQASEIQTRQLTEIELRLIKNSLQQILNFVNLSLQGLAEINKIELLRIEFNPMIVDICAPSESCIYGLIELKSENFQDSCCLCFPSIFFEGVVEKLKSKKTQKISPQDKEKMRRVIDEIPMEVVIELGRTTLRTSDILSLQVGDVLRLDNRIEDLIIMKIGGEEKFKVKVGKLKNNRLAVKIINTI